VAGRRHHLDAIVHTVRQCLLVTVALLVASVTAQGTLPVRAQSPSRVALVVHFGDSTIARCVSFDETEISGYDVLARSGLAITASFGPMGAAICAIEGVGCPAETCLTCQAPKYWSYWHASDGAWAYLQQGANLTAVRDGDIEGWAWGEGDPPPIVAFGDVCAPLMVTETPALTDTPESPPTPSPSRTPTLAPTAPHVPPLGASSAPSPTATPEVAGSAGPFTGYLVFGVLVGGLLISLLWSSRKS